jgi:protein-arginine deiminase
MLNSKNFSLPLSELVPQSGLNDSESYLNLLLSRVSPNQQPLPVSELTIAPPEPLSIPSVVVSPVQDSRISRTIDRWQSNSNDPLTGLSRFQSLVGQPTPTVDLRADTNRDGVVSLMGTEDDKNENIWNQNQGAILLPNIDDDSGKWKRVQKKTKLASDITGDLKLEKLNDANDNVVNGVKDQEDLAPLKIAPWQNAPNGTQVRISTDAKSRQNVRLFVRRGDKYTSLSNSGALTLADLRQGVDLGIEAKDIIRDRRKWDGTVKLTLEVRANGQVIRDRVTMRVSPVMFQHNLMLAKTLYATDPKSQSTNPDVAALLRSTSTPNRREQEENQDTSGTDNPNTGQSGFSNSDIPQPLPASDRQQQRLTTQGRKDFFRDLRRSLRLGDRPVPLKLLNAAGDIWTQDIFEPGFASMPKPNGQQQIVHIIYRSANVENIPPGDSSVSTQAGTQKQSSSLVLREGGRAVFTDLRGENIGAVQQVSKEWNAIPKNNLNDTYNSTGNFEAIPPYTFNGKSYPSGRMIFGNVKGGQADPSFVRMLKSQGYQDPISLDTSWLAIGHMDEFLNFVPAPTSRGWKMVVASPDDALQILKDAKAQGQGKAVLFKGKKEVSAQ